VPPNQGQSPATNRKIKMRIAVAEQPTKRFATVEEIAATVVFLCGEAANSITGVALPIDGGWTAH
jgi:3-hydroxybutyrate dehydrogenase